MGCTTGPDDAPTASELTMATAEGRTLPFTGPEAIDVAVLETFPYSGPDQEIVTETDEFSAVCPFSGLPDQARLTISYIPSDRHRQLSGEWAVTSAPTMHPYPVS